MTRFLACAGLTFLAAGPALASPADIEHAPVACASVGKFPRLEARFSPAEAVAAARLVFQGRPRTDKALGTNRTADYSASVVDSSGGCKARVMAGTVASASVLIQGPAGVVALPAGFDVGA